jgi:putative transcriptional regulator
MIIINLDVILARRRLSSGELAQRVGITPANLSILKTGKARAVRFSTLEAICRELDCQPGDILEYRDEESEAQGQVPFEPRLPPLEPEEGMSKDEFLRCVFPEDGA